MLQRCRDLKTSRTRGALASGTHIHLRPGLRDTASRPRTETNQLLERRTTMHATTSAHASPRGPKGHKGVGMEGLIATWYARQTAKDMERFRSTAHRLAPQIKP